MGVVLMVDVAVLDRAGELKRRLVEFSQRPRYERALREFLEEHGDAAAVPDEHHLMLLWECLCWSTGWVTAVRWWSSSWTLTPI